MKKMLFIILLISACNSNTRRQPILVNSPNREFISVQGLGVITLNGLKRDSLSIDALQTLFPVFEMPADTELRNYQPPLPGRYSIDTREIRFTPDIPFKAGGRYFARYYLFDESIGSSDILLKRRVPGMSRYIEKTF